MRGGGYLAFPPQNGPLRTQRAEEEGNIPAIIAWRTRRDASFSPGGRWTHRACRARFSTATALPFCGECKGSAVAVEL